MSIYSKMKEWKEAQEKEKQREEEMRVVCDECTSILCERFKNTENEYMRCCGCPLYLRGLNGKKAKFCEIWSTKTLYAFIMEEDDK